MLLLIAAAASFSAMSVLVKLAGRELPVATLVLARGVVTLALSAAWLRFRGIPPWGNDKPKLLLRALFGVGGLASFFYALTSLPLAEVTVLHYTNPIFTALIAAAFLGERADRRLVFAIALSLCGTLLVTRPAILFGGARTLAAVGVAAAFGSAVFSAFAYTTVRRLARNDHPDVIVFYFALLAAPVALPFAIATWRDPTPLGWLLLLGLGIATQLGQVFLTRGLALVPAARGTTVGYIQIVFAAAWGALAFDEPLSGWTLGGSLFIVVAVVLLLRRSALASPNGDGHPTAHAQRAPAQGPDP